MTAPICVQRRSRGVHRDRRHDTSASGGRCTGDVDTKSTKVRSVKGRKIKALLQERQSRLAFQHIFLLLSSYFPAFISSHLPSHLDSCSSCLAFHILPLAFVSSLSCLPSSPLLSSLLPHTSFSTATQSCIASFLIVY